MYFGIHILKNPSMKLHNYAMYQTTSCIFSFHIFFQKNVLKARHTGKKQMQL